MSRDLYLSTPFLKTIVERISLKDLPRFDILVVINDIVDHSMSKNFEFLCCSHVERTKYLDPV